MRCRSLLPIVLVLLVSQTAAAAPEGASPAPATGSPTQAAPAAMTGASAALSLRSAEERLMLESPALRAAGARVSAARAEAIAAGLWRNPVLSVTALPLTHGAVTGGQREVGVALAQEIPIAGQAGLRRDAALTLASAEEREFAAVAWDLLATLRETYLDAQSATARYDVLRAGFVDLSRVDRILEERARAGANSRYERLRVGLERSDLAARVSEAEADRAVAVSRLARAIGGSMQNAPFIVESSLPAPRLAAAASTEDAAALALARRPEAEAARLRVDASDQQVVYLRRAVVPQPSLSVGYGHAFSIPDADRRDGGSFLVGLSLPLPILDRGQGTIDRGEAEATRARAEKNAIDRGIAREVDEAKTVALVRGRALSEFQKTAIGELSQLREMADAAFREGKMSIVELLDAYRATLTLKDRELVLKTEALRAELRLERALGPVRTTGSSNPTHAR